MSDVSGPVSSLPGAVTEVTCPVQCDDHPDRPAVRRVQGETDSMGAEYFHLCQECYDKHVKDKEQLQGGAFRGFCCCGAEDVPLFPVRDWTEGTAGPVYYRCGPCKKAWNKRANEEFTEMSAEDLYDDLFDGE